METVRKEKKSKRLSISHAAVDEKSSIILKNLLALNYLDEVNNVAAFYSFQNEPNTRKLIEYMWSKEKAVFLPITHEGSLKFFNYHPDSQLIKNRFGIYEPDTNQNEQIQIQSLDVILVPLVAFDRACNRIGMGSGFYDKALSKLDASLSQTNLIGLAYDFQKVEHIESNKWDIPLDCVVTEKKVYHS